MNHSIEGESEIQGFHILMTREQHRRLRLVCTTLAVPMSEFVRRLVSCDVDRRFFKLGLDRVPVPQRPERRPGRIPGIPQPGRATK